ncbi:hypothetical protein L1765_14055 [Microaerobacter geothermalis]|uniref:hypothetical protein n=1 Tax=Microaerobacter geothermalis TaxID=674972 RepID=UPI001F19680C|nr:hypothetical protein [Microaerobacter geothermalis]MCF6095083.1 hypothetical protein [Microaerobacter geothermalis]
MNNHSFPGKGELCQNPECVKWRKINKRNFEKYAQIAEKLFEAYLEQENPYHFFELTKHARKRTVERAINTFQLFGEVVANGYVVGYQPKGKVMIIKGFMKIGKGLYRSLHVPLKIEETDEGLLVRVLTVFDPSYSSHLFDEKLEQRICWCQPHDLDEL